MKFAFTEDQQMLAKTVREVCGRECAPEVVRKAWEEGTGRAAGAYGTLAEQGVTAMLLSDEAGGLGMNEVDITLPLEEAGYAALPDPLVETALVALPLLEAVGTDAQKEAWLEKLAGGEAIAAVGFEIQSFVAHAEVADVLFLERGSAVYAVPRDAVTLSPEISVDRARKIARVEYTPDAAHLMAEGEEAVAALRLAKHRAVFGTSCVLLGLARRMLDMAVEYAKDREQFGKPIGAQQAVKHRLANALIQLSFAKPAVYRASWSLATQAEDYDVHVSMAKIYAAEAARYVAKEALQIHGAIGYTIECDLHMWMKRAWALAAAYGDTRMHREKVATHVLGPRA